MEQVRSILRSKIIVTLGGNGFMNEVLNASSTILIMMATGHSSARHGRGQRNRKGTRDGDGWCGREGIETDEEAAEMETEPIQMEMEPVAAKQAEESVEEPLETNDEERVLTKDMDAESTEKEANALDAVFRE